ncbi:hypothetical protein RchiOBHm_Chr6g0260621 [Rosa chinensis]|uniref:Uncharacterized protein n=1 Tax=Rosa chinensis TaxID=74649 RepID=A0A2P6PN91_ROSCH|nr:hypothetical protein RchiOBHm_Chr6g0260621 [Rosa chinensis]
MDCNVWRSFIYSAALTLLHFQQSQNHFLHRSFQIISRDYKFIWTIASGL